MSTSPSAIDPTRRTITSYEQEAAHYCTLVGPVPPPVVEAGLRRIVEVARPGGQVLEVGSGPGRDADFLEQLGVQVDRTDATQAFLDLQRARGKEGRLLNLLTDELGGPYDAVLALCVLIHIRRQDTPAVLRKVHDALLPGGVFYLSVRDGHGETDGDYHMTYWSAPEFVEQLTGAGLVVERSSFHIDSDRDAWHSFITRRPEGPSGLEVAL